MAEGPNANDPAQVLAQQVGGPSVNPRPLNTRTRLDQLEDKMQALSGIIDQVTTLEERLDGFSDDQAHVGERLVTLEGVVEGNMATLLDQVAELFSKSSSQSQQRAGSSNNYNKGKNGGYQARSGGDQGHGQNRSGGASAGGASSSNSGREYHRPRNNGGASSSSRMDQYDDEILELEVVAVTIATAVNLVLLLVKATQYDITPYVNRSEHRNAKLRWLYDESDIICHNMLRMNKAYIISFWNRLRWKGLRASKYLDVEELVEIFLLIVGHDTRLWHAQASTMRSLKTISKYFHVVLKYILRLGKDLIKHATPDLSLATRNNHHVWANTYLKDCVEAVDGTFISTTIFAGWEGLAHDNRILSVVVNNNMSPFTVLRGMMTRYYVVFVGRVPRVYETWEETDPQVSGEACSGGVALEEEEAPPVVEVMEAEDEDLGGMAVRDVHG
ncbi:hypothetical protein GIB67_016448 [Kingdonia uniflora]|uniref:Uncharacterized protein n=1 Tax=Kingdonia uniflora TaxID=39325 RepID=A0A7J7MH36_9MAGN|nr:hypothetical protein GIB67_016448 [Kingdonia uniflora]